MLESLKAKSIFLAFKLLGAFEISCSVEFGINPHGLVLSYKDFAVFSFVNQITLCLLRENF